ncbi:MAG: 3-hydroxyacyl-CoA dehydrogenase NAD-binding domain-containing protein, partial [Sphingomicrobium sp.]
MTPEIQTVGIIGAGQMGTGIAQVCALAGIDVHLNDVSDEKIKAGFDNIDLHLARDVSRGTITEGDRRAALQRIRPAPSFDDFADCDLVIEAA